MSYQEPLPDPLQLQRQGELSVQHRQYGLAHQLFNEAADAFGEQTVGADAARQLECHGLAVFALVQETSDRNPQPIYDRTLLRDSVLELERTEREIRNVIERQSFAASGVVRVGNYDRTLLDHLGQIQGLIGRTLVVRTVLANLHNPNADIDDLDRAQTYFRQTDHTFLQTGNRLKYVQNAARAARDRLWDGKRGEAAGWLGRAALGVVRPDMKSTGLIASARVVVRAMWDNRSRRAAEYSILRRP